MAVIGGTAVTPNGVVRGIDDAVGVIVTRNGAIDDLQGDVTDAVQHFELKPLGKRGEAYGVEYTRYRPG